MAPANGRTDSVLRVMAENGEPLTAVEIHDLMPSQFSGRLNATEVAITTLLRKGMIESSGKKRGRKSYVVAGEKVAEKQSDTAPLPALETINLNGTEYIRMEDVKHLLAQQPAKQEPQGISVKIHCLERVEYADRVMTRITVTEDICDTGIHAGLKIRIV